MPKTIKTFTPDGRTTGAVTVETLANGNIGLGFVREGQTAQAIRLPRDIARQLAEAILRELQGEGTQ